MIHPYHSLVFACGENERERSELITISFVEFVLELNPVETQCVKECTQCLHHQQHSHSGEYEDDDPNDQNQPIVVSVFVLSAKTKIDYLICYY